jgi:hypothetical protein
VLTIWFYDIEKDRFSMCTVDGMAASRSFKSECGVDMCYSVGGGLFAGWIACVVSYSVCSGVLGAGRAS